jgi:hypothetical protein
MVSSWVGTVWSLRRDEGVLIGQVREVDGESVTLAVVGLGASSPEGMELLPSEGSRGRLARISSGHLLGRWKRMGASRA